MLEQLNATAPIEDWHKHFKEAPRCKCGKKILTRLIEHVFLLNVFGYTNHQIATLISEERRSKRHDKWYIDVRTVKRIKCEIEDNKPIVCRCGQEYKFSSLTKLTPRLCTIFMLKHKFGQSNAEIARHLDVRNQAITQATQRLDELLGPKCWMSAERKPYKKGKALTPFEKGEHLHRRATFFDPHEADIIQNPTPRTKYKEKKLDDYRREQTGKVYTTATVRKILDPKIYRKQQKEQRKLDERVQKEKGNPLKDKDLPKNEDL